MGETREANFWNHAISVDKAVPEFIFRGHGLKLNPSLSPLFVRQILVRSGQANLPLVGISAHRDSL